MSASACVPFLARPLRDIRIYIPNPFAIEPNTIVHVLFAVGNSPGLEDFYLYIESGDIRLHNGLPKYIVTYLKPLQSLKAISMRFSTNGDIILPFLASLRFLENLCGDIEIGTLSYKAFTLPAGSFPSLRILSMLHDERSTSHPACGSILKAITSRSFTEFEFTGSKLDLAIIHATLKVLGTKVAVYIHGIALARNTS